MELMLAPAQASAAAAAGKPPTRKRKGPNLERVEDVGSSKRVFGIIPYEHWGERQYADAKAYIAEKSSAQRNENGCFEFTGKIKAGEKSPVAFFGSVQYNAQLLCYLAHHRDVQMKPGEQIVASCGNKKCLTIQHLQRSTEDPHATPRRRTPYYTLEQWKTFANDSTFKLEGHLLDIRQA